VRREDFRPLFAIKATNERINAEYRHLFLNHYICVLLIDSSIFAWFRIKDKR